MKCQVCGTDSGKYPLCAVCNQERERGRIIKCEKCGRWHYWDVECPQIQKKEFLYECRKSLLTDNEKKFYAAILKVLPSDCQLFPQINLATFIERTDDARYRNELFRNVDFLVTDKDLAPKIAIEINDSTHNSLDRKKRDAKVHDICEEAGIPLITLWTKYDPDETYIRGRIEKALSEPPKRVAHAQEAAEKTAPVETHTPQPEEQTNAWDNMAQEQRTKKKQGCYIATCVYGSYDCPQVWVLRRYRDSVMKNSVFGRLFIRLYYAVSPTLVRCFGELTAFRNLGRRLLDPIVAKLAREGMADTPYSDQD